MTLKTVQTETQDEQISAYHELLLTSLNIYATADMSCHAIYVLLSYSVLLLKDYNISLLANI